MGKLLLFNHARGFLFKCTYPIFDVKHLLLLLPKVTCTRDKGVFVCLLCVYVCERERERLVAGRDYVTSAKKTLY